MSGISLVRFESSAELAKEFTVYLENEKIPPIPDSSDLVPVSEQQEMAIRSFSQQTIAAINTIRETLLGFVPVRVWLGIIESYIGNFDFSFDFNFVRTKLDQKSISMTLSVPCKCFSTKGFVDWKTDPSLLIRKWVRGLYSPKDIRDGGGVKRLYFVNPRNPLNSSQHLLVEETGCKPFLIANKIGDKGYMRWMTPELLLSWEKDESPSPHLVIDQYEEYHISAASSQSEAPFKIFSKYLNGIKEYSENANVVVAPKMDSKKATAIEKVDRSGK